jgi:FlaA1/EpsC-like NDP-sugar epimerase
VVITRALTFISFRSYAGIIRYTNTGDTQRIAFVVLIGSLLLALINLASYYFITHSYLIPFSILTIEFLLTVFLMSFSRLIIQSLYHELHHASRNKLPAAIIGADDYGTITKHTLENDTDSSYKVVAFFDDEGSKTGKTLEKIKVYPIERLTHFLNHHPVSKLIIAKKNLPHVLKEQLLNTCLEHKLGILSIPDMHSWIDGTFSFQQIKQVEIEELLERKPIVLDASSIREQLVNQVVLITGAAGSIGSELTRQILRYRPRKMILLDQAETPLYDLELELTEKYHFHDCVTIVGDVSDEQKMHYVFKTFRPTIVYHAAAYKHVPLMESNPDEAVRSNISGTRITAEMAHKYEAGQFVLISTDKAVNPTSIMGASKRVAEIYIRERNESSATRFVTTRFGNVLGSNGSVIPRFRQQIAAGGPVTVTHPEITRYFMTLSEACQLVLEAGSMARGGEIYLFDMGESLKIDELAKKMIHLSGLEAGRDIQIRYTGLRPGEKLHEDLVNLDEHPQPTHHEKIMIVKERNSQRHNLNGAINELEALCRSGHHKDLVRKMQSIVPEFKPPHSTTGEYQMI